MIRSFLTVSTGTLASRLLGFARDAMIAALLGAGPVADAFLVAFQLVNVVRRLLTRGRAERGPGAGMAARARGRRRRCGRRVRRTRARHRQRGVARGGRADRPVDAAGHDGAGAGVCRTRDAATCGQRCPPDAALSRLCRAGHGDDGAVERARPLCADGVLAAAVQHRADRGDDRAARSGGRMRLLPRWRSRPPSASPDCCNC